MEKKKIGVTLPPALHDSVKILATRLGIHVEEAYGEALTEYLKVNGGGETTTLSPEALRLARAYDQARLVTGPEHASMLRFAVQSIDAMAALAQRPPATAPSPSRPLARSRK